MPASVYDIPLKKIDGTAESLGRYRGKVLLIVNVASKCGLTPQYQGLESLYQGKRAAGLEVLGFPANNFAGQEPGTDGEIRDFCTVKFDVHCIVEFREIPGRPSRPHRRALRAGRHSG